MQQDLIRRTENRRTFVFYEEWAEVFEELSPVDYTQMVKAIVNYALYINYIPDFTNAELRGIWKFIKRQLDADIESYMAVCEKRKAAGAKGGKTKAENQKLASVANDSKCYTSKQKPLDNDYDNDNDNVIDNIALQQQAAAEKSDTVEQQIINTWNDMCAAIPAISPLRSINNQRARLVKARIKEYGLVAIIDAIGKIKESDFLQGKGKKGWTVTFDWFILPANFAKVLEGNYSNSSSGNAAGGNSGASYNINAAVKQATTSVPTVKKKERR